MATGVLMTVLVMLGIGLVPYLIVEERQNRTWDVLMVSPAGVGQVIVGKALAGGVYCFVASGVVLALNHVLIVHWSVAVLAVLGGTLFSVALGLLLGSLFEQSQNMSTSAGLLAALLILPPYAVQIVPTLPEAVRLVFTWMPSTALTNLFRVSLSRAIPAESVWTNSGILAVSAAVLYALVAWRMSRMER
jgi:ABC-2 type transport system permease protein